MTEILGVNLSNDRRVCLSNFILLFNGLNFLICLFLVVRIFYISHYLPTEDELIPSFDSWTIPITAVTLCGVRVFLAIIAAKTWSEAVVFCRSVQEEIRGWVMPLFVSHLIMLAVFSLFGLIVWVHLYTREPLAEGITNALEEYKTDRTVKVGIDWMQINFLCCGGNSFKDWFEIDWFHKKRNDDFSRAHTPFSCCNKSVTRPCIHYNVDNETKHKYYRYEADVTLYRIGCGPRLDNYLDTMYLTIDYVMFFMGFFEIMIILLSRILQVSFYNAMKKENHELAYYDIGRGYLYSNEVATNKNNTLS